MFRRSGSAPGVESESKGERASEARSNNAAAASVPVLCVHRLKVERTLPLPRARPATRASRDGDVTDGSRDVTSPRGLHVPAVTWSATRSLAGRDRRRASPPRTLRSRLRSGCVHAEMSRVIVCYINNVFLEPILSLLCCHFSVLYAHLYK